jgi:phosphoribosylglycinamide formyltransferase-1
MTARRRVRVAVLISGGGTNLQSLIDSATSPDYPAEIALVISSSKTAFGLERARRHGVSSITLRQRDFDSEQDFANGMLAVLDQHRIDLICLAGYLKLVPDATVKRYRDRILNIHPALLPKFGGQGMYGMHVHEAVIASHESESGATVHFVDEVYDNGRILLQKKVPVLPDDTPDTLQQRVLQVEHELYPEALAKAAFGLMSDPEWR